MQQASSSLRERTGVEHGRGWLEALLAEAGHHGFLAHLERFRFLSTPDSQEDLSCP